MTITVDVTLGAGTQRLGSLWDGLSPRLIAEFYEVYRGTDGVWRRDEALTVAAPLLACDIQGDLNWQSPFEGTDANSKAPMLLAMLQSGSFQPAIDAASQLVNSLPLPADAKAWAGQAARQSERFAQQFEGRAGITTLNSTQVFTGMQPVKISVTALFRAWRDPAAEVKAPVDQLWKWALPQYLAPDGTLVSRGLQLLAGTRDPVSALMPSKTPVHMGLRYKGYAFYPLVIEHIDFPMGGPTTVDGRLAECQVQMSLGSLTAWDTDDWGRMSGGW